MSKEDLRELSYKKAFICDMDGVLYHGNQLLPGATEYVEYLKSHEKKFLFLTNSSERSPQEISQKLSRLGLSVTPDHFYTSAMAMRDFLKTQQPGGSAYVIGEAGLIAAVYEAGYSMNDVNPDYVIVGETRNYNIERIEKAVSLVLGGARLLGANPDITGPTEKGLVPATGALIAPIELATGKKAYFVGKPNALMIRHAKMTLHVHSADAVMIGDRMDTDIVAGVEAGVSTVLVLSGVTKREDIPQFAFQAEYICSGVGDIAHALSETE